MPDFAANTNLDSAASTLVRRSARNGVSGKIDECVRYLCTIEPWFWLVAAYGFLIPVVALNLPGVGGLGAADLLMPVGAMVLVFGRRTGKIQLSHIVCPMLYLSVRIP